MSRWPSLELGGYLDSQPVVPSPSLRLPPLPPSPGHAHHENKAQGELRGAIQQLWLTIAQKPDLSSAWLHLGIASADLGLDDDAIAAYQVTDTRPQVTCHSGP